MSNRTLVAMKPRSTLDRMLHLRALALLCALALLAPTVAGARTVYRCVRDGTVSLATAPEPGSECFAKQLDDNAAALPNLWGAMGVVHGSLYQREQDGKDRLQHAQSARIEQGARLHRGNPGRIARAQRSG